MPKKEKSCARNSSDNVSRGASLRAMPVLYFLFLAAIFGGLIYAVTQRSDAPVDRNVPGATTGAGKASLND
jgi:hypothetical protein